MPTTSERPERPALLLVDVQNDFCPGGALPVPQGHHVIPPLSRVSAAFSQAGHPVYASRDWHPPDTRHFQTYGGPWPEHCVAGTTGAAFHPDLWLGERTVVVSKGQDRRDDGYSAFEGTTESGQRLMDALRGAHVTTLYVGGLATDYCVRASVLDARAADLDVTVLIDGCGGIDPHTTRRAMTEMRAAGAGFMTTGELLAMTAEGPNHG